MTTHLALDLTADFSARTLAGTAALTLARLDPDAAELVLDTRDLDDPEGGSRSRRRSLGATRRSGSTPPDEAFGSALHIVMPPGSSRARITYVTSPTARGLQWLTPAQTAGKRHPFLFTQAQAIQARSFIPLQDVPGVRVTYDATLRTPPELVAVMAAEMLPAAAGSRGVHQFRMPQPIPSYLIALAVGDLTFRTMGDAHGRVGGAVRRSRPPRASLPTPSR